MTASVEDKELTEEEVKSNDTPTEQKEESDQDRNWRAFLEKRKEEAQILAQERERNKQLEADNSQHVKRIEEMKTAFQALLEKRSASSEDPDEESERKKIIEEEVTRILESREKKSQERSDQEKYAKESIAVKQEMPDLLEVCSQENLLHLEYYHPEIAIPLGKMPDGYEKTKLAYQAVKKHVKMKNRESEKIEKNLSKPKSLHSSVSNEGEKESSSGAIDDKMRASTWAKMQRLMSGQDES